jgi:hypothetical protein
MLSRGPGEWSLDDAVDLKDVAWANVMPLKEVLASLPKRELTPVEWEEISHGRSIQGTMPSSGPLIAWHGMLPVAILEPRRHQDGLLKPRKVL